MKSKTKIIFLMVAIGFLSVAVVAMIICILALVFGIGGTGVVVVGVNNIAVVAFVICWVAMFISNCFLRIPTVVDLPKVFLGKRK